MEWRLVKVRSGHLGDPLWSSERRRRKRSRGRRLDRQGQDYPTEAGPGTRSRGRRDCWSQEELNHGERRAATWTDPRQTAGTL
jgi:hypothetical protein